MEKLEEQREEFEQIYFEELGMCGCGSPDEVKDFLLSLLENHNNCKNESISYEEMKSNRQEIIKSVDTDIIFEIIFHMFESADLVEHGSSVYGSWFTEKGDRFLKLLRNYKDYE